MPAYVIVDVHVHNPEGYTAYRQLSGPSVEQYGGRGGGRWAPDLLGYATISIAGGSAYGICGGN